MRQVAHPELPESAQGVLVDFALGVPALGGPPRALEPGGIGRGSGLDLENGGPAPAGKLEGGDEGLGLSPTTKPSLSSRGGARNRAAGKLREINVISPSSQAGTYLDMPYVHVGRKLTKESVTNQADDNTVVAMVPIEFFSADNGSHAITAWAVVVYDMALLPLIMSKC